MDTITLTLSLEQLNVLLAGLGHIPLMHAQPVLTDIQRQIAEQAQAHEAAESAAAEAS